MSNDAASQQLDSLLHSVGKKCFVNCFDDFEAEANGLCAPDATKRAMSERGGARTYHSIGKKASSGVLIIKHGLAEAALESVRKSKKVPAGVRTQAQSILDRLKGRDGVESDTRKSPDPRTGPDTQYWLYKCGPSGTDYGDWDVIFRATRARDWYADGMKVETWGTDVVPKRGDIILAQQSEPTPRIVGLAEVVECPPPCRLRLRPLHSFPQPVFLRPLKERQEAVMAIRALHGGIVASLYLLSNDDARVLLEAIMAPKEFWPNLAYSVDAALSDNTLSSIGAGFGTAEENRKVEVAAINFVSKSFTDHGWAVSSVEDQKCGYDLRVTRGKENLHVEVKGIRGEEMSFVLTANEHKHMLSDKLWQLAVVTRALSMKPELRVFSAREAQSLSWTPMLYRATNVPAAAR